MVEEVIPVFAFGKARGCSRKEKAGSFAHESHELHEKGGCFDRIYRMDIVGSGT